MHRTFKLKYVPADSFPLAPTVKLLREAIPIDDTAGQIRCDNRFLYGIEQSAMKALLILKLTLQASDFRAKPCLSVI
jgi:hypothetical protein